MKNLEIPYNFTPRAYQRPIKKYIEGGGKRAVAVWHRRGGKDKTGLNIMIEMMLEKVGVYYYFLPTYNQGRKIIWDGIDKDGFKFIAHFPKELIAKKNDSEMKIVLKNGSLFQIVGTDNFDSVVGTNPIGTIWSEYSLQNPSAWDFVRPILTENEGWAMFLYTPRGRNHGWQLYEMAKQNPEWFCEKLTILDTGVVTPEDVEREIREGMDPDLAQQEFYCSFEGPMAGSYYGKLIEAARTEKRIVRSLYDNRYKVNTAWDLGFTDTMVIWFFQEIGAEVHLIDYFEQSGEGLAYYAKKLQEKPYVYGRHIAPHDIKVKELGTGKSRYEVAMELGINFELAPNLPVEEGIDTVRRMFNKCWFDEKCDRGINALASYHREYDDIRRAFKDKPFHDWASHASDAFRMLALGRREGQLGHYIKDPEIEEFEKTVAREAGEKHDPLNPFGV